MNDINKYSILELRQYAKNKGLTNYSRLKKEELYKLIFDKKYKSRKIRSVDKKEKCSYGVKKDGNCKKKPGPKSSSISRRKPTLKSRSISRRKPTQIKSVSFNKVKQVAFCFLLYDTIDHVNIWEEFFDQDIDGTSAIYAHFKTTNYKSPAWLKTFAVKKVKTHWCGEGLIHAFVQMLKKGLENINNQYFVLLSGSCIPLYTYKETYKKILSTPKTRMTYEKYDGNVFEDRNDIYNAHQWVILNRETAKDYINLCDSENNEATKFIKNFRKLYKENGVSVGNKKASKSPDTTWLGGCPDEIYPINWLHKLYGRNLSKHVKNQMTTYTSWDFDKDPDHPETFNINTVKRAKKEICSNGHIFARKFTTDAAKYIAMNCGKGLESLKKKAPNYIKLNPNWTRTIVRKELVGRLGNQMFQYASSLGIAYTKNPNNGIACIITDPDIIQYDELRNSNEDLMNVCKGPFHSCDKYEDMDYITIPENAYAKYNIKPFLVEDNIEIETDMDQGFLQSYKYFDHISDIVRKKFEFKNDIAKRVSIYMEKIKSNGTTVIGIHARRGDHLSLGYMKFPPPTYFHKARDYFRNKYKKVKFIVATNDKAWATETFKSNDTDVITHSKSAPEDLAILGACDGVIMSLGTFSWWGAWLSGGPVIYYKNEFNMSHPINKGNVRKSDYYLPQWIGMS